MEDLGAINGTVPGETEGKNPEHRWKNISWAGARTQKPSPLGLSWGVGADEHVCW